jgi:hypothetical protein
MRYSRSGARSSSARTARPPVQARAFTPQDEAAVLQVLQAAFGRWPRGIANVSPSEFFHWKHMAGPLGSSTALVAEIHGRVIGVAAYMPWRFRACGRVLKAMRGVDFAVDPAYQRSGASMAIRAAATFPSDFAFIWSNPNAQSHVGGLKSGRHHVGGLPRFLRPRRHLLGALAPSRRASLRTSARLPEVHAETVSELLSDQARVSSLATEPGSLDRLATVKDRDYLSWRYGRFAEYRAISTDAGDERGGTAIFRLRRHGRFWVSHVCELLVGRDQPGTVRELLKQVERAAPADFISCNFASRHHAARHGFLQQRGRTALMTYPLHGDVAPDPAHRDSWTLSLGDLELL